MGFVFNLICDACDFVERHVIIGLVPGCESTLTVIQDQESGAIRNLDVSSSDVEHHAGKADFGSDDEWEAAMESFIESQISKTERQVTPYQVFCPKCRERLRTESVGIS